MITVPISDLRDQIRRYYGDDGNPPALMAALRAATLYLPIILDPPAWVLRDLHDARGRWMPAYTSPERFARSEPGRDYFFMLGHDFCDHILPALGAAGLVVDLGDPEGHMAFPAAMFDSLGERS